MPEKILHRAQKAVEEKVFPGCVIGVSQNGVSEVFPFGTFAYEKSENVQAHTTYDLASITKSIPTASLAALYIARGELHLDDEVKKFIPEMENHFDATIEDLLHYRVRGPRFSTLRLKTFEQFRTHVLEQGFSSPPGRAEYTNMPAYVLGVLIERMKGVSLPLLAQQEFFGPLGMDRTTYFPAVSDCAPTEIVEDVSIQGVPHDESARLFALARRSAGHAGLFSNVPDLLRFCDALLQGKYPVVVQSAQHGHGWSVNQEWFMGTRIGETAFGKTGFTGTSLVIDQSKSAALVILSNRTFPQRPPDATSLTSSINILRRDIADIVFG